MSLLQRVVKRLGGTPEPASAVVEDSSSKTRNYRTVTVTGVSSATSGDGGVALILATTEIGPVAFRLDLELAKSIQLEVAVVLEQLGLRLSDINGS